MVSLDQLKESYQMLNEELSKQQVVNEQLMNSIIEKCRTKIKKESNWMLRWNVVDMCLAGVFSLVSFCYILFITFSASEESVWTHFIAWSVFLFCVFAFVVDYFTLKKLRKICDTSISIQEMTIAVSDLKRWVFLIIAIVFGILLVFGGIYFYYMCTVGMWSDFPVFAKVLGIVFSMLCGFGAGYLVYRWLMLDPLKKIEASCREMFDVENISETSDKED